jgi:hypothetical protein
MWTGNGSVYGFLPLTSRLEKLFRVDTAIITVVSSGPHLQHLHRERVLQHSAVKASLVKVMLPHASPAVRP